MTAGRAEKAPGGSRSAFKPRTRPSGAARAADAAARSMAVRHPAGPILAVDPGLQDLGWAVVEPGTGRVLDLGVVHQERIARLDKSTCRATRLHLQAGRLRHAALVHGCKAVAAEAMSFNPKRFTMALGLGMSWGGIAALAIAHGLDLYELPPKRWQHAVTGVERGKVDYEDVARRIADYLHGDAAVALAGIKPAHRTHALDAVGVGVFVALRPEQATRIGSQPAHILRAKALLAKGAVLP